LPIDQLDVAVLERYVADGLAEGLAPATINRHLNVVSLIVRSARKRKLLRENPVELVDRPVSSDGAGESSPRPRSPAF
jgi:hypothetical protein